MLGPFQLEEDGRRITIGGFRQRALFASLLLHANEVVPSEQLLVDLWSEDRVNAANALQAAISRLRRALPKDRLVTTASGYMLRIFPDELDTSQFEQLVSEGREFLAAGEAAQAARTLRQALSLWQGSALADFRYEPFAQAEIARLEELHLLCQESRVEADLASGSASVLIPELRRLVSEHPLRERLRGQLMLALYRDGRQTEALEAYREFRNSLLEELGLEPTPHLRELQVAILRHDQLLSQTVDAGKGVMRPRNLAGHAFISYVREDSRRVDVLQQTLQAAGVPVWRDTADLRPGEDWRIKIRRAITDNALVFIACFSRASIARVKGYQNEELVLAVEQLRLRPPDNPWLIPVRFDECEIPDRDIGGGRTLTSIQRADLFGEHSDEGTARLVASVMRILERHSHIAE
jgi:DNA-binding SARP family transcriptional activator